MIELKIIPHVGIGPIRLGRSRAETRDNLSEAGFPLQNSRGRMDYFCEHFIQVEYDDDELVHFIGIACHRAYLLTYEGINVFGVPAPQVFAEIAARDGSGVHEYDDAGLVFPNQIVTLWEADEQYDRLGGEQRVIWGQAGLGNRKYLDAINRIQRRGS